MFDAISRIEIALRTQLAYQWSLNTRCDSPQAVYKFYDRKFRASSFLLKVDEYYQRSTADCAVHYRDSKGVTHAKDLPIWVFVEFTTFGNLSQLVAGGLKSPVVELMAREFGFKSSIAFSSAISLLREVRNACAHHERIWNCRWLDKSNYPRLRHDHDSRWDWSYDDVEEVWYEGKGGVKLHIDRSRTAAVLTLCYKMLSAVAPCSHWRERFFAVMDACPIASIDRELGFASSSWRSHPLWVLAPIRN